jgi:hypothetical protein
LASKQAGVDLDELGGLLWRCVAHPLVLADRIQPIHRDEFEFFGGGADQTAEVSVNLYPLDESFTDQWRSVWPHAEEEQVSRGSLDVSRWTKVNETSALTPRRVDDFHQVAHCHHGIEGFAHLLLGERHQGVEHLVDCLDDRLGCRWTTYGRRSSHAFGEEAGAISIRAKAQLRPGLL